MMSVGLVDCLEPNNGENMRARSCKRRNMNGVDQPDHTLVSAESKSKNETKLLKLETSFSFKNLVMNSKKYDMFSHFNSNISTNPPSNDFDAAATKLQNAYKSYRTRRSLADCAVVVEELWWKTLGFQALGRNSTWLSESDRPEPAISRWARAKTMAATVGKGLSKHENAQKLALRHWLEAIDPRHRYGHNLHLYYNVWFESESSQPFFFWLDVGKGREVNVETCPRTQLQHQCVKYLGPKQREEYEVIVKEGKLLYKQNGEAVDTLEGTKWIFVLSASRKLYVGQKKKGLFQHSSFLAGGAVSCAGRLVAHNGVVEAIWSYSGHYRPTPESFEDFVNFLEDLNVDLTNVKQFPIDDDVPPSTVKNMENVNTKKKEESTAKVIEKGMKWKWSTGAGARIGCVREYPTELQAKALEQVNLSPRRVNNSGRGAGGWSSSSMVSGIGSIPSPRPSHRVHLSPRLACMGLTSPKGNNNSH